MEAVPRFVPIPNHAFGVEFHPAGESAGDLFASCHVSGEIIL